MNNHILSISTATRSAIRKHIEITEKPTEHPYLDIKGNVTIGVGFKSDTEDDFAKDVRTGRDDTRALSKTIDTAFGPLFHPTVKVVRKEGITGRLPLVGPETGRGENLAFQATVNDLGSDAFGRDKYKPIREDGFIGPKTETAFNRVLPAAGPDRFTSRLGHNLGFFDFGDF